MKENGCDLLQRKRSDGLTVLHIAACANDVHVLDYVLKNVGYVSTKSIVN